MNAVSGNKSKTEHIANPQKYVMIANAELARYQQLGSVVRALGKGWHVDVSTVAEAESNSQSIWNTWQELLTEPTLLQLRANVSPQFTAQLVVSHYLGALQEFQPQHLLITTEHLTSHQTAAADLVSKITKTRFQESGVYAWTGSGKGKTTGAIGQAWQQVLEHRLAFKKNHLKSRAAVVQWFKEKATGNLTWAINEHRFPEKLKEAELLEFFPMGLGFFGSPKMDRVTGEKAYQQHRARAQAGLSLARRLIESGQYTVIVLDELVDTVAEIAQNITHPLLELTQVQEFFEWVGEWQKNHSGTPTVIVTGRRVNSLWQAWVKESVVVEQVKHPWQTKHQGAISGLDF